MCLGYIIPYLLLAVLNLLAIRYFATTNNSSKCCPPRSPEKSSKIDVLQVQVLLACSQTWTNQCQSKWAALSNVEVPSEVSWKRWTPKICQFNQHLTAKNCCTFINRAANQNSETYPHGYKNIFVLSIHCPKFEIDQLLERYNPAFLQEDCGDFFCRKSWVVICFAVL